MPKRDLKSAHTCYQIVNDFEDLHENKVSVVGRDESA